MSNDPNADRPATRDGRPPFFIVGASRSGTTLMRLVLNAHPRLAVPGETGYFVDIWERYSARSQWGEAVDAFLAVCRDRLRPPVDLEAVRVRLLARPVPDFRDLLALPMERWAANEGKDRWGEKTPEHIFYSAQIAKFFPDAKFIELIRDPRAAVASMNRSVLKGSDSTRNALYWRYVATEGHRMLAGAVAADHRISVRYEDLVGNPEETLRAVCTLLGEEFDDTMLSFYERTSTYLSSARSEADPRLSLPFGSDLYAWRRALSTRQLAITEKICGDQMVALGYDLESKRAGVTELGEIACKQTYVAWKHHQQRDRCYHAITGPPLGRLRRAADGLWRRSIGHRDGTA